MCVFYEDLEYVNIWHCTELRESNFTVVKKKKYFYKNLGFFFCFCFVVVVVVVVGH